MLLIVILCYTDLNWENKVNIHIVVYRFILLSVLTMVVTDRSFSRPRPEDGTVPLGWARQSEAFMTGEALRRPGTEPLVPGPDVAVI